jgi:hypothetical protein
MNITLFGAHVLSGMLRTMARFFMVMLLFHVIRNDRGFTLLVIREQGCVHQWLSIASC